MHGTPLSNELREGDAAAFVELVQRIYAPAIAFARTRCADDASAEALLLDAYVAVYVRRREAGAARGDVWMLGAVMSECASRTETRDTPPIGSRWRARARGLLAGRGLLATTQVSRWRPARCAFRLLAPLLLLVLTARCHDYSATPLVGVIGRPPAADTSSMVSGDTVRVRNGRTTIVVDGARLTFVRVESDSRCPSNVVCVWAGDLALRARVEHRGVTVDSVLHLNRQSGRDALRLSGLLVQLVSVEPNPVAGRPTADSSYVARFVLSRASGDAPGSPRDSLVADSVRRRIRADAEAIAIRLQRLGRTPAQQAVEVPASLIESLYRALIAVETSRSPARDTVARLYVIRAAHESRELLVSVDSTAGWVRAWQRGQRLTGNPAVDTLLERYGLVLRAYHPWSSGHAALLAATRPLNVVGLVPPFTQVAGVRGAEHNGTVGGSMDITAAAEGAGWRLTYVLGYGDCPAGCIHRRFWTFRVDSAGLVTYLGSTGSPPPPPGARP